MKIRKTADGWRLHLTDVELRVLRRLLGTAGYWCGNLDWPTVWERRAYERLISGLLEKGGCDER